MALTVSGYGSSGGLRYKIAHESTANQTADIDVFGTGGTILSMDIDNQHSSTIYFKLKTTSGAWTSGSTDPDFQWRLAASPNGTKRFDFPDGIPFSQLTFWCNSSPAASATDAPGGNVLVTFICS